MHPSLRLALNGSSGLGVSAAAPVASGTLLISLPPHLPLSLPSSLDHPLHHLASVVPEELWALKLGLRLLMERAQTGSFWWPYISNLPQRFNVPVFFTGDDIADLQYAPVIHQVKQRCRALINVANQVEAVLAKLPATEQPFGGQEVNASSLGWAMAAVSSRAFQVHSSKEPSKEFSRKQRVLLPLIDMCNHSFTPNARIIQHEGKEGASFVVVAEHNLQAGTNILLSYGSLSNDLLLLDYGFVVPQNSHDYIEMRYDKGLLDAARMAARLHANFLQPAEWQVSILKQLKLEGSDASVQVKIGGPNLVDGRCLAALRVLFAQDSDLLQGMDIGLLQAWDATPLGNGIESMVLKTTVGICALLLGHFPTTIIEDEATLQSKELSEAGKLALEYRITKKKVLVGCMQGISQRLYSLGKEQD